MTDFEYQDGVPQTIKVVSAYRLLELEALSNQKGFNQNLPIEWLANFLHHESPHFLFPSLIHKSAGGRKVTPHLRSILRFKVVPQKNWRNSLYLVSLIDLPIEVVEELNDINLKQAIWLGQYLATCGPSVAEFSKAVTSS